MKILMLPHYKEVGLDNGVGQVLANYHKWFPKVGVEITTNSNAKFDLACSHLGHYPNAEIHFSHGLNFGEVGEAMAKNNANIIVAIRNAKCIVVPSNYVAETFRRDLRISPQVIGHGINIDQWKTGTNRNFVLWNKNRNTKVCDPLPFYMLASENQDIKFTATFKPENKQNLDNLKVVGRLAFGKMKHLIQNANIYVSTSKETFGIGTLESLACGVPVLGFDWGGTKDIVTHKQDGYLVRPGNYRDFSNGLRWLLENREKLTDNCKQKASQYSWLSVVTKLKEVFEQYV